MTAGRHQPVSVIFVNHNSTGLLQRALDSLRTAEPELQPEIIVVDNASRDRLELRGVCQRFGARLVLRSFNSGYGAAANRGFALARGQFVAIANPDIVFHGGEITRLVRCLAENDQAGAVAPQLVWPDGQPQPTARRYPSLRYVLGGRRSPLARLLPGLGHRREFLYCGVHRQAEPVSVEAVIGAFVLFRRTAFSAVGGFDESYHMFAEDMDICRRLRAAGWNVLLDPRVRLEHFYGGVRRRRARYADHQRIRSLHRFMSEGYGRCARLGLLLLFGWYLSLTEAGRLIGIGEFEYSWHRPEACR